MQHAAPILLLMGPPGAGKTAAIHVLASELKLQIQEWANPVMASGDSEFVPMDREDWRGELILDWIFLMCWGYKDVIVRQPFVFFYCSKESKTDIIITLITSLEN
jgi:DNA polymerase III delta prime subunit